MTNVIPFPIRQRPKPYAYENCPKCGTTTAILNVDRSHWGYCSAHRLKWFIGENLFSSWRDETLQDWLRNSDLLCNCTEVEPLPPGGSGNAA